MSSAALELRSEVQEGKILDIKLISTVLGQVCWCSVASA